MTKPKLTPWINGKFKPVRKGLYEREYVFLNAPLDYWDGKQWWLTSLPKVKAAVAFNQERSWRGLAENPNKGKK